MKSLLRRVISRLPARVRLIVETAALLVVQRFQFRLKTTPGPAPDAGLREQLADLMSKIARDGYTVIPGYKSPAWCEQAQQEVLQAISAPGVLTRHPEDMRVFGIENLSPHAREFAGDPLLNALAGAYAASDEVPIFCMANRVEYRAGVAHGSGGEWHRDSFTPEIKAMLYLTDVAETDGPFAIVHRSHRLGRIIGDVLSIVGRRDVADFGPGSSTRMRDAGTYLDRRQPGRAVVMTASRGTLLLFDTSAIHTGLPPKPQGSVRIALTNYYCPRADVPAVRAYYEPLVKLN